MSKKTITAVLVIILCIGIGLGGMKWYQISQIEAMELKEKSLCNLDWEQITEMTIKEQSAQTFVKEDGHWKNKAYPTVAYNQALINNIAYQIGNLKSYKIVKNVKDMSTYGIQEASKKITLQDEEGEKATYWVGMRLPEENGIFIWYEEKDELALVLDMNLASVMVPTSEMIEPFIHLPSREEIKKIEVKQKGEPLMTLSQMAMSEDGALENRIEVWEMTAPFSQNHQVDKEQVEAYMQVLESMKKEKLVEDESVDLEAYGLEVPELQVILNDTDRLDFGFKKGENVYFKMNDEKEVYEIPANIVNHLTRIQPFEWIDKAVYIPDRTQLSFVEIQYLEERYHLQLKEAQEVPTLNGKLIEPSVKEHILKALEGLSLDRHVADAKLEEANPRQAALTIRYSYLNQEEVVLEFVPYDPSFYLLRREGIIEFATAKKSIVDLLEVLRSSSIQQ